MFESFKKLDDDIYMPCFLWVTIIPVIGLTVAASLAEVSIVLGAIVFFLLTPLAVALACVTTVVHHMQEYRSCYSKKDKLMFLLFAIAWPITTIALLGRLALYLVEPYVDFFNQLMED